MGRTAQFGIVLKERAGVEMFPNLQRLTIWKCPLLVLTSTSSSSTLKNVKKVECSPLILPSFSSKLENLSSLDLDFFQMDGTIPVDALEGLCDLKKLTVRNVTKHRLPEKWSRGLNSLTQLELSRCKIGSCLPEGWLRHPTSLEKLNLHQCREFADFSEEFKHLHLLNYLSLDGIPDMLSLPQDLQKIASLQSISLISLHQLTSLPAWLANLTSLTCLEIHDCPKIESLPSSIQGMTNLRFLQISGCPELERRCEKANGEDWPKIAHVPQLHISPSPPF